MLKIAYIYKYNTISECKFILMINFRKLLNSYCIGEEERNNDVK